VPRSQHLNRYLRRSVNTLTQVGALQTAPILIAVVTAFLTMEGVKYLLTSRKQARAAAAKPAAGAKPATSAT
jgi:ribosomal protein S12